MALSCSQAPPQCPLQELTNILWAMAKLTGGAPKGEEMQAFISCVPSAALHQLHDEASVRKVNMHASRRDK